MLNKKQTDLLFQQNAILIGDADGMPRYRAVELLGKEAVDCVMGAGSRCRYSDVYGIGDCCILYLTYRGFQAAATYVNIREIETRESTKTRVKELELAVIKKRARV